jgi:hypothetical protein
VITQDGWYDGQYSVIDATALEGGQAVKRGEIMKHRSGAVIIRCPRCNALQFTAADVQGPPDAPTLSKPIQCGAGTCKRCGVWFRIAAGKAIPADPATAQPSKPIPEKLARAGVKAPPMIKEPPG